MAISPAPKPPGTSSRIVFLAGIAIIAIAVFQTVTNGHPDQYTIGALLALALGGSVGRVADTLVKGYVAQQVTVAQDALRGPLPPAAPAQPDLGPAPPAEPAEGDVPGARDEG